MRILSLAIIILGIAAIASGAVFIFMANSANNEIVTSVLPLTVDQVNPKYDAVTAKFNQVMAAEEPAIQGGTAAPSALYNYLSAQRGLLGLAKTNIGVAKATTMSGYLDIGIGLSLAFAGIMLMAKKTS
jgi:hypothetical protein